MELNDAGWKMLAKGDGARAARLFAEALSESPDDPVLNFGAGTAAHVQGRPREAVANLQRALRSDPMLTAASLLLGKIAYEEGDVALAISTYEKALKYAPRNTTLIESLNAWRADATVHGDFEERRFDRFRVMFQGRADEALAASATEILNSAFWRIGDVLGGYPSEAVVVMLYTEQQFRDITRSPEWSGGVYDGRIRIPASGARRNSDLLERVLVHELTHAMIAHMASGALPSWLHEGLAQHFEGRDAGEARRRLRAGGRLIPMKMLERGLGRLNAADAQVAYDESLVAVATILQRPGFGWTRLFEALASSDRTEYTLDSFGLSYPDMEAEFR